MLARVQLLGEEGPASSLGLSFGQLGSRSLHRQGLHGLELSSQVWTVPDVSGLLGRVVSQGCHTI